MCLPRKTATCSSVVFIAWTRSLLLLPSLPSYVARTQPRFNQLSVSFVLRAPHAAGAPCIRFRR